MDIIQGTCFRDPINIKAGEYEGCERFQYRYHHLRYCKENQVRHVLSWHRQM